MPRTLKVAGQFPADAAPIYTVHKGTQGVLPMRLVGVTSQLSLPPLMPLSVAGCGKLQLEAPHWATSVALLQVVDN